MNRTGFFLIIAATLLLNACGASGGGIVGSDGGDGGSTDTSTSSGVCIERELVVPAGQTEKPASIAWDANRESGVNESGGGYRVYYCQGDLTGGPGEDCPSGFLGTSPEIHLGKVGCLDVPYVSGPTAPTSAILNVSTGSYVHIRVQAYSALNESGGELSDKWSQFVL